MKLLLIPNLYKGVWEGFICHKTSTFKFYNWIFN